MRNISLIIVLLILTISCEEQGNPVPNPDFVYFKVAEIDHEHGDSYILPLINTDDITQAREMIADPAKRKIIVAEITKDNHINYYVNKDIPQNKRWSWHVAEFLGFADTSIEIYDGWPQYVEDHYNEWVQNTKGENGNGRIGFWNYTIVQEINKAELGD